MKGARKISGWRILPRIRYMTPGELEALAAFQPQDDDDAQAAAGHLRDLAASRRSRGWPEFFPPEIDRQSEVWRIEHETS